MYHTSDTFCVRACVRACVQAILKIYSINWKCYFKIILFFQRSVYKTFGRLLTHV